MTVTYEVVKRHRRLHIAFVESEEIIYTPPDFVRLPSRDPLKALAHRFTILQRRDLTEIADFEARWTKP